MESCLYQAALHREELLRNFYRIGQRQMARQSPWGFVIPTDAARSGGHAQTAGDAGVRAGGDRAYRTAGDNVIRMAQPYSGWAKALLERQHYPDMRLYPGGPPQRPYDVTAHTLPLLMGVQVDASDIAGRRARPGGVAAISRGVSASDSRTWKTINRTLGFGRRVWRNTATGDFAPANQGAGLKQDPAPAHRPLPQLHPQQRRRLDPLAAGAVRLRLHARLRTRKFRRAACGNISTLSCFPMQTRDPWKTATAPGSMPPEFTGGLETAGRGCAARVRRPPAAR